MQWKPNKNKQDVDRPPLDKIDFKARSSAGDEKWYFINRSVMLPGRHKNSIFCT